MKIAGLYLLYFVFNFTVAFVFRFVVGAAGIVAGASFVTHAIQQFIGAVPIALGSVITAVTYYELRNVKEGVSIDSLANVFD